MTLSLNQIIQRVKSLALSHRQINHFFFGDNWEFDQNGDISYPGCFLELISGTEDRDEHLMRYSFRIYFADRVGVSEDTEGNETEVLSDMNSVALDMLALLRNPVYQDDWIIGGSNNIAPFTEGLNDLVAGVTMDITIATDYFSDACAVPADDVEFETTFDMPRTRLYTYTGSGLEGDTISIGFLSGKPILAVYRAGMYKRPIITLPTNSDKVQVGTVDLGSGKGVVGSGTVRLETGDALINGEVLDFLYYE